MRRWVVTVVLCAQPLIAFAQPAPDARGALLYATHCGTCHDRQMHWRRARLVTDWPTLVAQVRRWQAEAQLNWGEDDVEAVARYLDAAIYRLPRPQPVATLAPRLTR